MPTSAVSSETKTPPHRMRVDHRQAEALDAAQQHEAEDREDEKKQRRGEAAARRAGPQQPDDQRRADDLHHIDPPALGDRIGAIAQIVELLRR